MLTGSNRRAHVRDILVRLSELAEVKWLGAGTPTGEAVAAMREMVAARMDWPGQIRARRDLVMLLVGYSLALRRSELCALTLKDVEFVDRGERS